jgi:hypothetical protein
VLKLSRAVSQWRPAELGAVADPVLLLQAAWSDIVGAEVAQNSGPVRLTGGTLVVATRSAAWSHQLSFLAERVRDAICVRLPSAGVERLRFRVGSLPKRGGVPPPRRAFQARAAEPAPPPSQDAGQALARFARHVDAARRAKQSEGWKECAACGALVPPSRERYCGTCRAARLEERATATVRLLFDAPWLGFSGTAALVDGLCKAEYESIRSRLLKRWWGMLEQTRLAGRVSRDGRERLVASSYVVLRSKLQPEEIVPATVRNVLGDELHDLLYADEQKG